MCVCARVFLFTVLDSMCTCTKMLLATINQEVSKMSQTFACSNVPEGESTWLDGRILAGEKELPYDSHDLRANIHRKYFKPHDPDLLMGSFG